MKDEIPEMPQHFAEPWQLCTDPKNSTWFKLKTIGAESEKDARRICDIFSFGDVEPYSQQHANGVRIVTCVNYCAGLSHQDLIETKAETLKQELVVERYQHEVTKQEYKALKQERDRYRKALEDIQNVQRLDIYADNFGSVINDDYELGDYVKYDLVEAIITEVLK